jgi:general secretion pathway protein G
MDNNIGHAHARQRGFTLVELVVVISIILILISVALPSYTRSIQRAKESVLHDQLFTMRELIDEYTMDKQQAPQSLDDLVSDGYLREIPKDPMTNSRSSWKTDMEDSLRSADQTQPGIVDVHSTASGMSLEGTAYTTW